MSTLLVIFAAAFVAGVLAGLLGWCIIHVGARADRESSQRPPQEDS